MGHFFPDAKRFEIFKNLKIKILAKHLKKDRKMALNKQIRTCVTCGDTFVGHRMAKYCEDCKALKAKAVKPVLITRTCRHCGKEFSTTDKRKVYCTRLCRQAFRSAGYYKGEINVNPNR